MEKSTWHFPETLVLLTAQPLPRAPLWQLASISNWPIFSSQHPVCQALYSRAFYLTGTYFTKREKGKDFESGQAKKLRGWGAGDGGRGAVFKNKENSGNLLKGPCLPLPIKQSRADRALDTQRQQWRAQGRGPRSSPHSAWPPPYRQPAGCSEASA